MVWHDGQWSAQAGGTTDGQQLRGFDFYPGPLRPTDGMPYTTDDRADFNRFWSVAGYEVERHIEDWSDNAYIDYPQISIVGWPGHGNSYFKEVNGFDLPVTQQGAAPFHDRNGDGIYNAFDGDYPLPDAVAPGVIPWQIIWMVYNDAAGPHLYTQGQPLGVEVQLTAWAFPSTDEPLLNKALFVSKKIINRSGRDYTDFYAGIYTGIGIGCPLDDYIGCIPEMNAYYGYNATETDKESCLINGNITPSFEEKPPVQAVTLLNQHLTGFNMFYHIAYSVPPYDTSKTHPVSAVEYFNYLTGKWRDGTPFTSGGNGYAPGSVNPAVSFAFPDNPNDPDGWSQVSASLPPSWVFGLGVVRFDSFKNGEIKTLDVVYSTHQDFSLNHVENVNLLYDEIPRLQQMYDDAFAGVQMVPFCKEECVWPGDANGDGIADHFDLLAIGAGYDSVGPSRLGLKSWTPLEVEDWSENLPTGLNFKHLDANGDGQVNGEDFEITKLNLGQFNENYWSQDVYRQGPELFMTTSVAGKDGVIDPDEGFFTLSLKKNEIPGLAGIAFTLEFDTQFIEPDYVLLPHQLRKCLHFAGIEFTKPESRAGNMHFSIFRQDSNCPIGNESMVVLKFVAKTEVPEVSTWIRFKNGRALLDDGTEIPIGGTDLQLYFLGFGNKEKAGPLPGLTIYPNPSDGVFYFRLDREEVYSMRVYDATGRLLDVRPEFHQRDFMIDLRIYGAGVYFLEMNQGRQLTTKKLVVVPY